MGGRGWIVTAHSIQLCRLTLWRRKIIWGWITDTAQRNDDTESIANNDGDDVDIPQKYCTQE